MLASQKLPVTAAEFMLNEWMSKVVVGTQVFCVCVWVCWCACVCDNVESKLIKFLAM